MEFDDMSSARKLIKSNPLNKKKINSKNPTGNSLDSFEQQLIDKASKDRVVGNGGGNKFGSIVRKKFNTP